MAYRVGCQCGAPEHLHHLYRHLPASGSYLRVCVSPIHYVRNTYWSNSPEGLVVAVLDGVRSGGGSWLAGGGPCPQASQTGYATTPAALVRKEEVASVAGSITGIRQFLVKI